MESPSCWRRICKTLYSICVYAYLCMCVMSVCSRLCHYATHQSLSQLLLWRYAKVIICSTLKGIKCGGSANKLGNNSKFAYVYVCMYVCIWLLHVWQQKEQQCLSKIVCHSTTVTINMYICVHTHTYVYMFK